MNSGCSTSRSCFSNERFRVLKRDIGLNAVRYAPPSVMPRVHLTGGTIIGRRQLAAAIEASACLLIRAAAFGDSFKKVSICFTVLPHKKSTESYQPSMLNIMN